LSLVTLSGYKDAAMNTTQENLKISLEQALTFRDRGAVLIDVRSPAEYSESTIPGAINIPIFTNDERAEIGTMYKQVSKQAARFRGIEIVAPKIPSFIHQAREAADRSDLPLVVFCWRGGERSRAMATFFDLAGIPARQIEGGHKLFRNHVLNYFDAASWGRLLVLRGLTGVGKTFVLKRLAKDGYPIVDLEGLANHRGSAFGNLGLPEQPGQKMFEALLWDEFRKIPTNGYVLVEGESRHIGRVLLPKTLHSAMQGETSIWLTAEMSSRIRCILDDYPARDDMRQEFEKPILAIKDKLGGEAMAQMLELLRAGRWEELVQDLMVRYYDPLYQHTFPDRRIEVEIEPFAGSLDILKKTIAEILAGDGSLVQAGGDT
jgi:tRNA 2-selenouridine synthase